MTQVSNLLWGPAAIGNTGAPTAAITGFNLNDADNAAAWTFNMPKDGTVTHLGFYMSGITGSAPNYNVALVAQDSSGRPTTTAYGGGTNPTYTPSGGAGWKWVAMTANATAAAGDFAAVHIYPTGSAPNGSNFMAVLATTYIATMSTGLQFTTAWVPTAGVPPMAIKFNDGSIYGLALSSNTNHVQIRQNTTPDEVGAKFTVPAQMTCYGARFYTAVASIGTAATFDVVLYDAADGVLATCAVGDKDYIDDNSAVNVFWDGVTLQANTVYRVSVKPGVGTNGDMYIPRYTLESTAAKGFFPDGANWQWTSRTDAGAWTDTSTDIPFMGLWISDITFVQGSGSGGAEWGFVG